MSDESQDTAIDENQPAAPVEESSPSEPEEAKVPEGVQKRINTLTWQRHEAEREAESLRQRLDSLEANQRQPEPPKEEPKAAPHPDDFETDAGYRSALDNHIAERASAVARQSLEAERTQTQAKQQQETRQQSINAYREKVGAYAADHESFATDVQAANLNLPDHMVDVLTSSEKPGEVTHYLAQNPEHAIRMSKMSPVEAARELAKVELTLETPKQTSSAPTPMSDVADVNETPPTGQDPANPAAADKMTVEEWARQRKRQVRGQ